jgi:hypothetical protein
MCGEIGRHPPLAERGCVGAQLLEQIAEDSAFLLGKRGIGHRPKATREGPK